MPVEVKCVRCAQWFVPRKDGRFPQHPAPSGLICSGSGQSAKTKAKTRLRAAS